MKARVEEQYLTQMTTYIAQMSCHLTKLHSKLQLTKINNNEDLEEYIEDMHLV